MQLLRLKEVLKQKEVTSKDLAEQVSVSVTTISNIISGRNFPKGELLLSIANTLDVDIRELFIPTKEKTKGNLNGFVEYNEIIYRIQEKSDLEQLILEIE